MRGEAYAKTTLPVFYHGRRLNMHTFIRSTTKYCNSASESTSETL